MTTRHDLDRALSRAHLPASVRRRLAKIFSSSSCPGAIPSAEARASAAEAHLSPEQLMVRLLPVAQQFSVAPISEFHVGAISRGSTESLYMGANMEFVGEALSFCTHGEQAATVNAWMHGEDGITALAITDPPCGYCRQFLYELIPSGALEILLPGRPAVRLDRLLPLAFGPRDLGLSGGMMKPTHNGLTLERPTGDPLVQAALAAANASYAPYSGGCAGIALATRSGQVFTGRYAENAAYNPSVSPMEVALALLNLCGASLTDLARAVLVQARPSDSSQVDASTAVLKAVSRLKLEIAFARRPAHSARLRAGQPTLSRWARLL